jgi:tight adherence protein B
MSVFAVLFGLGVFLVYDAVTSEPRVRKARDRPVSRRAAQLLLEAGYPGFTPRQLILVSTGAGLGAAVVVVVMFGSVSIAALAWVAASCVPVTFLRAQRRSRRRSLRQCWPEAVELLAGAVRAGDTLPAAISVVAEKGPEALRPAFRSIVADHRVSGDLAGALDRAALTLADPTADRVLVTLSVAHRVGGRELGRVLRTLAAFLREDLAVRKEVEARQSWTVVAARVAAAAPWIVLFLVASRPQGRRAFDSVEGMFVLVAGAVATIVGYRMMLALGRLPEEPRVLGGVA